jgi:hypothetical protein
MKQFQIWFKSLKNHKTLQLVLMIIALIVGLTTLRRMSDFSLQSLFKFDFATSVIPGWHSTVFPPFYILNDMFSTAIFIQLVLITGIWLLKTKAIIPLKSVEIINILLTIAAFIIGLVHVSELIIMWYSGYFYEQMTFYSRVYGTYWWMNILLSTLNLTLPFLFFWKKIRTSIGLTFLICFYLTLCLFFEDWILSTL